MHLSRSLVRPLGVAALLAGVAVLPAQANLVYLGSNSFQGTGLGATTTVLTLQGSGSVTGSVGVAAGGGGDVVQGSALTGASQTRTRSITELGIGSASDLRIVFNASEPGAAAQQSITLADLQLNIYGSDGTVLFNSGSFTPVTLDTTDSGTGKAGFIFGLDATQAAQAQTAAFASLGNRIGLSATTSGASGGLETFYVTNAVTAPVPEPGTLALLCAGVGVLLTRARRQQPQD